MNKNILIIFVVVIIFVALAGIFLYNQKPLDLSKVSDSQIISLLDKNPDAKEYMQSHPDFRIENKTILTKESILAGRNGPNFREIYQILELQDNRYMRVDLINSAGDKGLITTIDFKTKTVQAYALLLFKASAGANQNGQTPSQTTNK